MYLYCFITDINYLPNTLVLLEQTKERKNYVLCLDESSLNKIKKLHPSVKTFTLSDFNIENEILEKRDKLEFVFMLKSYLIYKVSNLSDSNDYIVYLDSDMFFFSDIAFLENEIDVKSVFITPHRFTKENLFKEKYGKYNAGFVAFKNDTEGLKILDWWMKKCTESCSVNFKNNNIYADQKYLDDFCTISKNIKIINNIGINLAPWNVGGKKISILNNKFFVDDTEVIIYHFHGLKKTLFGFFNSGLRNYKVKKNIKLLEMYKNYIFSLRRITEDCKILEKKNYIKLGKEFIKGILKKNIMN